MKTLEAGMTTHIGETVTSLASIFRLTRRDGKEFYFTSHDVEITYDDGDGLAVYEPENGYDQSAIVNSVGMSIDNIDMVGLFATSQIKESELRAGLFDYAAIKLSLVNWKNLSDGNIKMRRGRIGEVVVTNHGTFRAELRGMVQNLTQAIVENYSPECRADLGDPKCGIPIRPDVLPRSTAVELGDFYRVVTLATTTITYPNLFLNSSFERGTTGDGQVPSDWSAIGVWDLETGTVDGLAANDGSNFLRGGSASGTLTQTLTVADLGISQASIDAGDISLDFSIQRANTDVDDTGRVVVEFLDTDGATLAVSLDTTEEEITPVDTWVARSVSAQILPATTTDIRVTLNHTLVTGIQSDSCFDNIVASILDSGTINTYQEVYENRVYEVTTAGTTAVSQPAYDTTIDNTTTDGTAVLTAKDSFTRDGHVTDVTSTLALNVAVTESRAIDDWFNGGVIVFDSGKNFGEALEIRDWTQANGAMTVFLEMPFNPVPGTPIHIYPGCDKRVATCFSRFANVINFRGEPYVPDADEELVRGS